MPPFYNSNGLEIVMFLLLMNHFYNLNIKHNNIQNVQIESLMIWGGI